MKIGDLVTLSSYGALLRRMSNWRYAWHQGKLIGLLTAIEQPKTSRYWDDTPDYTVTWIGDDGPSGREPRYKDYFNRKDLKIVKRA